MSIVMHDVGLVALIMAILVNMMMLRSAADRKRYTKRMRIYMPFSVMSLAAVMFTGTVMMASKHLAFDMANIVMVLASIVLIVLESRRYRELKYMDRIREGALEEYKSAMIRLMAAELAIVIIMAIGMYLL